MLVRLIIVAYTLRNMISECVDGSSGCCRVLGSALCSGDTPLVIHCWVIHNLMIGAMVVL